VRLRLGNNKFHKNLNSKTQRIGKGIWSLLRLVLVNNSFHELDLTGAGYLAVSTQTLYSESSGPNLKSEMSYTDCCCRGFPLSLHANTVVVYLS
jgi:hypothetical protein